VLLPDSKKPCVIHAIAMECKHSIKHLQEGILQRCLPSTGDGGLEAERVHVLEGEAHFSLILMEGPQASFAPMLYWNICTFIRDKEDKFLLANGVQLVAQSTA